MYSVGNFVAVVPPEYRKIETTNNNGFITIDQKTKSIEVEAVMHCPVLGITIGDLVILKGDAGLRPWAKQIIETNGVKYAMCPVAEVIGYIKGNP